MHIECNNSELQREVHSPEGVQQTIVELYISPEGKHPVFHLRWHPGETVSWTSDSSANVSGSRVWRTSSVNALWLASGRPYSLILVVLGTTRLLNIYSITGR